jgi:hypothetical protein
VPNVVASRARANWVPSHWPTTQANSGTKHGSVANFVQEVMKGQ